MLEYLLLYSLAGSRRSLHIYHLPGGKGSEVLTSGIEALATSDLPVL